MNQLPQSIPLGRLSELSGRHDADLIAYTVIGFDAKLRRFNSRNALRAFCKDGSKMFALVKEWMPSANHVTNRNLQTA